MRQSVNIPVNAGKLSFLYSPGLLLFVAILALFNNLDHSATVYQSISKNNFDPYWLNWLYAIIVNILIDISVIAFVVNGRHIEAGIYAFFIFIINILYYDGLGLLEHELVKRVAQITYSIMFTYSIYIFSFLYFEKLKKASSDLDKGASIDSIIEELREKEAIIEDLECKHLVNEEKFTDLFTKYGHVNKLNSELNEYKVNRIKELTCEKCGFVAVSDHAISGHRKGCKQVIG